MGVAIPRRFVLVRSEDESGVSGTGVVAVGVEWPDGAVDLQWRNDANDELETARNGFASYHSTDGLADALKVHGHGGRTAISYHDSPGQQYDLNDDEDSEDDS